MIYLRKWAAGEQFSCISCELHLRSFSCLRTTGVSIYQPCTNEVLNDINLACINFWFFVIVTSKSAALNAPSGSRVEVQDSGYPVIWASTLSPSIEYSFADRLTVILFSIKECKNELCSSTWVSNGVEARLRCNSIKSSSAENSLQLDSALQYTIALCTV